MLTIRKILVMILLIIIFIHPTIIHAEELKYAEIFDPKQNKVVKVVQLNTEIYNTIANWIKNVDGIYGKNDPFTNDGYAIRIPLEPTVKIQRKMVSEFVNEVYIIIPQSEPPFIMIFENKNKLLCFPFNGDIDTLSKILDFKLKNR